MIKQESCRLCFESGSKVWVRTHCLVVLLDKDVEVHTWYILNISLTYRFHTTGSHVKRIKGSTQGGYTFHIFYQNLQLDINAGTFVGLSQCLFVHEHA